MTAKNHPNPPDTPGTTTSPGATGNESIPQIDVPIRVRYVECDPMNVAHHSVYPVWMEAARTELLRSLGTAYRDVEAAGHFLMIARMSVRFRRPALYDDEIVVRVRQVKTDRVKIEHEYEFRRDDQLLATGSTTLACTNRNGRLCPLPSTLQTPQHA